MNASRYTCDGVADKAGAIAAAVVSSSNPESGVHVEVRDPDAGRTHSVKARSADRIVLLVDDDTAVRQMLARALAFEAFVVVEAANGLEALERLRQGCGAGVIVLDLRMPVMDGWAFRRAQRADPKIAKTPVVVLSGADVHRFAELEALAAFEKPVRISELAVRLHQIFEEA